MNRHGWLNIALMAILVDGLFLCAISRAEITSVRIVPAQPTTQDTITFTVEGMFLDGCWHTYDFILTQVSSSQFAADVYAFDTAQEGVCCPLFIVHYSYSGSIGLLGAGTYTVFVTEYHQSIRDPLPDETSMTFEIMDFSPIRNLTAVVWGSNITLRWTGVEAATGYKIYRATVPDFEIGPSFFLDSTVTGVYTDTNAIALPDEKFFYCVTVTR